MAIVTYDVEQNLVVFGEKPPEKAESLKKRARLFYVGIHKGRKYTKKDLEKIAENFKSHNDVPIQLDHSTSALYTVGKVRNVEQVDGELFGDLEFLGKEPVDNVRLGKWDKVSVGLKIDEDKMQLQEVSITPFPYLKNARIFSEGGENMEDKKELKKKPEKEEMQDTDTGKMVSFAEFKAIKAEIAQMKKEKAELEETVRMKDDQEIIEKFIQDGKTTPAMREAELKLFHSLDDGQRKLFQEWKDKQPVLVDFKVHNRTNVKKPGEPTQEEVDKEADELLGFTSYGKTVKV